MKIFVGLSGGVDSSVSALLLQQQGHSVEGVFMKNWTQSSQHCQITNDLSDAQAVASTLNIPLHIVDFSNEYWDSVFEDFLKNIELGRTPNPDILCNKHIKFDKFYQWCKNQGAEKIATGHYAGLTELNHLIMPVDMNKDQTYFLWAVSPIVFKDVIFPLAHLHKEQVRTLAKEHQLITHNKQDSTGICFIGPKNFRKFLSEYMLHQPGIIRTTRHDIIGKHDGLGLYTLGQRSGLKLGGQATYNEDPWYVVQKNYKANELIVSQNHYDDLLMSHQLTARDAQWLYHPLASIFRAKARIRHLQELQDCTVYKIENGVKVEFDTAQRAITAGQSIVFYQDKYCLGGAIIDSATWPSD
jgi:tRNA-specific 2-thiouridylase